MLTTGIKMPSARRQAKQTHLPRQTSPDATPAVSPFAWLPYYLPQDEMEAVWRTWGWRVLGQEPVAEEDHEAFEIVCRQLHTNWGAVYRPVALLPALSMPSDGRAQVKLLNQCLAAGWTLHQQHATVTAEALSALTGHPIPTIEPLLPKLHAMLAQAMAIMPKGATHV
jgi:hypothetical protein